VLGVAVLAAVVLSACGASFQRPAAVVNGVRITDGQLRDGIPRTKVLAALIRQPPPCGAPQPGEGSRSTCVRATLDLLIRLLTLRPYAERHRISVTRSEVGRTVDSISSQLGASGITNLLRQYHIGRADFDRLVRDQVYLGKVRQSVALGSVSPGQVLAYYGQHKADFTQLHLSHISLRTKALADRVARMATAKNFAALAKRYSTDQASARNGGDLGTIPAGRLPPAIVQPALRAQPGAIVGPVQISGSDWEVLRVISVSVTPLVQVKDQIVSQLAGPAFDAFLTREYRAADIQVNPRYGRFDPSRGEVVPILSTSTQEPAPSPSAS
jgi:parvulin-like peptidyl-prolyl isomerase